MISHRIPVGCLAAAGLFVAGAASAQSIAVTGTDGQVRSLDAVRIAALPRVAAPLSIHGTDHVFRGPLLIDVLKAAGVVEDAPLRGPALAQAVIVRAADGYAVVFGLAELDPATRADPIVLADEVDGGALTEADGPFRVVAAGDLRPARSARQVTAIEIAPFAAPSSH